MTSNPIEPGSAPEAVAPEGAAPGAPPVDVNRLTSRARKNVRKLQRRIKTLEAAGRKAKAAYWQKVLLRSFSACLVATDHANRRLRPHRRVAREELPQIAAGLNAWRGTCEPVLVRGVRKRGGDLRPISSFGLRNKALQRLAVEALEPRARFHRTQFMVGGGGRRAASAKVLRLMQEGDYKWVVHFDVVDCYPSLNAEGVADCLPLPRGVTDKCVVSRNLNVVVTDAPSLPAFGSLRRRSLVGIPQGSAASAYVVEMLLAQAISKLHHGIIEVVNYADNILVFTHDKTVADAISTTLPAVFRQHPAGSLRLKHGGPRRICDGFDFLGYSFRRKRGVAKAEPSDPNRAKFQLLCRIDLTLAKTARDFARLQRFIKSWCAAFELWEYSEDCRDFWISGIEYAAGRRGISLQSC